MSRKGIFIGGTGRSGTTILAEILNQHPDIYSLPYESRFITDPDGLYSLYKSLYPYWSFFQSDMAVSRFLDLMKNLKTSYSRGKYPTFGISKYLDQGVYDSMIEEYISNLNAQPFKSAWAGRTNLFQKSISRFMNKNRGADFLLEDSHYLSPLNEDEFIEHTSQLLKRYFNNLKYAGNSKYIVDHTPSNIVYSVFINKILPDAKIVHIYRNPLDILCSFKTKGWGSKDVEINTQWVFDTFRQWNSAKKELPAGSFVEVKFEQVIEERESELKKLCEFLDISFAEAFDRVDLSEHNIGRWKKNLDTNTAEKIFSDHKEIFEELGYSI